MKLLKTRVFSAQQIAKENRNEFGRATSIFSGRYDPSEPAFEAREIKRILLSGIDQDDRTWCLELSAAAAIVEPL